MKASRLLKALFPGITTIIFFVLFTWVYWAVTNTAVKQYYFEGLLFAVPFVCFGIITCVSLTEKFRTSALSVITATLIVVFGLSMTGGYWIIAIDAAAAVTTDTEKYERVLTLQGYPNDPLTRCFPDKIPENAENIEFLYHPAFVQGGERLALMFQTDSDSIKSYMDRISRGAKWVGKTSDNEAERHGIFNGRLSVLSYTSPGLPEDFVIYIIDSEPYRSNDWNHGERSLIAISEQKKEILFLADNW